MTNSAYIQEAHISWEEAVTRGQELRAFKDTAQWELGDLALKVDTAYGHDAIGKFSNDVGINKKSLQQYRRVSTAFPPHTRVEYLSHRHHLILAAREDRFEWIKKAADNNWTTTQLYREVAIDEGRHTEKEQPDFEKCDTCQGWRVENPCKCVTY